MGISVVVAAVLAGTVRAGDDPATATCDGPTALHVGDWAEYRVKVKDGAVPEREVDELWTVEELTADAVLFSIKSGRHTWWDVVPRREGTQAAVGVLCLALTPCTTDSGPRPATLRPPTLGWQEPPAGEGTKVDLEASARRVKLELSVRGKDGAVSEQTTDVELDPTVPIMGVKRATVTVKRLGTEPRTQRLSRTLRRHGGAAGGAAPSAPTGAAGRTDLPILLRAKLEQNPFADLQVGAKARFAVTRTSCLPGEGPTKHQGRVEVAVAAREGGQLTLTFTVLEGMGEVARKPEYVTHVPTTAPAALEPHRWIDQLLPLTGGEVGGGLRCKSASNEGGRVTLSFGRVRYEAAFGGSPVGFSSATVHLDDATPGSWAEFELKLDP